MFKVLRINASSIVIFFNQIPKLFCEKLMSCSLINPGVHVPIPAARDLPAAISLHRPSLNFPADRRQRVRFRRIGLSSSQAGTRNAVAFHFKGGKGMDGFEEMEFQVRDYELGQNGVVSDGVYASYCQHGIEVFSLRRGLSFDSVAQAGEAFALAQSSLKFIAPLRSGDRFLLRVRVDDSSATRMFFEQFIYKLPKLEPILRAMSTAVWLDQNHRPVRIPEDVRAKFTRFFRHGDTNHQ